MTSLADDQNALYTCIAAALRSKLSAEDAASQVFAANPWTNAVQPNFRTYSLISCVLKKHVAEFLEPRISAGSGIFNSAPAGDGHIGAQTLLVLLKAALSRKDIESVMQIAFRFYKLADRLGIRSGDEPAYSFATLIRAIPFEMLQDIVNVTHIDEVAACVEVLYEAMSGIERVAGVPCLGPFAHACSMLQSKVVESEGEEQLGKIVRWMFMHLPDAYKPALNVGHNINMSHPVNIAPVPDKMVDSLGNPVDKDQYTSFWSLQHSLYDVNVLYDGDKWGQCMQQIECVLKACSGPTQVEGNAALKTASEGTVAYLSSPSLLTLQLQDVTFRRQQLVQIAMLLHYAQTCTSASNKNSKLRPPLSKIHDDCVLMLPRVLEHLKVTGTDGTDFEAGLRTALELEVGDIRRKAELTQGKQKTSQSKKDLKTSTPNTKSVLDDLDMIIKKRQAWQPADWPLLAYDATLAPEAINLTGEICGSFPSEPLSGLEQESLHDKVKKDMTTIVKEMKLEKAKKRIADPMFQWRTLRLLARANLKIYSECITERDADLEYAACEFLKDEEDLEMKQHVKEYLSKLPPTARERRKEAKREKAHKKHGGETGRKRPGHETDSGNVSHGTPSKKARTDTVIPSKRSDGGEVPAGPNTTASPLSARSAGEIPADEVKVAVSTGHHRASGRPKDSSREAAGRVPQGDLSDPAMVAAREAVRDAQDDANRLAHAAGKRSTQRPLEAAVKAGREEESHIGTRDGQRERKPSAPRIVAERPAGDERGVQQGKSIASEPAVNGHSAEWGRGDNAKLPGPPSGSRPREAQALAPLVAPSQRGSRMTEQRRTREREESNVDAKGASIAGAREGVRAQPGPEQVDRAGRAAGVERRSRDVAGGLRGSTREGGTSERDGDRVGAPARGSAAPKHEPGARGQNRLLGHAMNQAAGDGARDTIAGGRRGNGGGRVSPAVAKTAELARDRSGTIDNGAPASKRARSDVRGEPGTYAPTPPGSRLNTGSSRHERPATRPK